MVLLPIKSLRLMLRLYEITGLLIKMSFILRLICRMFQCLLVILLSDGRALLYVVINRIRVGGSLLISFKKISPRCGNYVSYLFFVELHIISHPLEGLCLLSTVLFEITVTVAYFPILVLGYRGCFS